MQNLRKQVQKGKASSWVVALRWNFDSGLQNWRRFWRSTSSWGSSGVWTFHPSCFSSTCVCTNPFNRTFFLILFKSLFVPFFHSEELFYQLGPRQFGDFSRIKLEPPPSLRSMHEIVVEADESTLKSEESIVKDRNRRCTYITHRKFSFSSTNAKYGIRHAGEHSPVLEGIRAKFGSFARVRDATWPSGSFARFMLPSSFVGWCL